MQAISGQTTRLATGGHTPPPAPAPAEKAWTLLFYNAGHADESKMCTASLLDLERTGSDANTDVVVMNHRSPWLPEKLLGINQSHNGTRTYALAPNATPAGRDASDLKAVLRFATSSPKQIASPEITRHADDTNMGEAETLRRFLVDSMTRYPARHYALFVSGHGAAFGGQAIVHQPEGRIRNEQLATVLEDAAKATGKRIDVVNLNTCFGASIETVYPLRKSTDAVVASQGTIFAGTQPFGRVLADIQQAAKEGRELSGADVAKLTVEESRRQPLGNLYTETLSAIDCKQVDRLASAVDGLYGALVDHRIEPATIREAWKAAHRIDYSAVPRQVDVTDVGSFAEQIAARVENPTVRQAAAEVQTALKAAVIVETHADPLRESLVTLGLRRVLGRTLEENPALSGVTAYLDDEPAGANGRLEQIKKTAFGQETRAAEFLQYMAQGKPAADATFLGRLQQKHAVLAQKVTHATRIPGALKIAERVALGATMIGTFHALNAVGIPAYAYGFGTYFTVRGLSGVFQGLTAPQNGEGLTRRTQLIDAAAKVGLGAATATFGLYLLGVLPGIVAWPAALVAGGVRVGKEIAHVLAAAPERKKILADDAAFAAASVDEKLGSQKQVKETPLS